jgi:hypothetical protein
MNVQIVMAVVKVMMVRNVVSVMVMVGLMTNSNFSSKIKMHNSEANDVN